MEKKNWNWEKYVKNFDSGNYILYDNGIHRIRHGIVIYKKINIVDLKMNDIELFIDLRLKTAINTKDDVRYDLNIEDMKFVLGLFEYLEKEMEDGENNV